MHTSTPNDVINIVPDDITHTSTSIYVTTRASSSSAPSERGGIPQEPYCFIVNTDSISFVIDIGGNRIIVNDAKYIH